MTLRCPYCKATWGDTPLPQCPACGKAARLTGEPVRALRVARRRAKEQIAREAERKRAGLGIAAAPGSRHIAFALVGMALLAAVGAFLVSGVSSPRASPTGRPRDPAARTQRHLDTLAIALQRFRVDCFRYPTREEGLGALVRNPGMAAWDRPYVNQILPDGWRRSYRYYPTNDTFVLFSAGADGMDGTADDLHPHSMLPTNAPSVTVTDTPASSVEVRIGMTPP